MATEDAKAVKAFRGSLFLLINLSEYFRLMKKKEETKHAQQRSVASIVKEKILNRVILFLGAIYK